MIQPSLKDRLKGTYLATLRQTHNHQSTWKILSNLESEPWRLILNKATMQKYQSTLIICNWCFASWVSTELCWPHSVPYPQLWIAHILNTKHLESDLKGFWFHHGFFSSQLFFHVSMLIYVHFLNWNFLLTSYNTNFDLHIFSTVANNEKNNGIFTRVVWVWFNGATLVQSTNGQ